MLEYSDFVLQGAHCAGCYPSQRARDCVISLGIKRRFRLWFRATILCGRCDIGPQVSPSDSMPFQRTRYWFSCYVVWWSAMRSTTMSVVDSVVPLAPSDSSSSSSRDPGPVFILLSTRSSVSFPSEFLFVRTIYLVWVFVLGALNTRSRVRRSSLSPTVTVIVVEVTIFTL